MEWGVEAATRAVRPADLPHNDQGGVEYNLVCAVCAPMTRLRGDSRATGLLRGGEVMEADKKLFRVTDNALVVYRGSRIVGVKHSELGPWLVWDLEHVRWTKALPEDARAFEDLPLGGSVEN